MKENKESIALVDVSIIMHTLRQAKKQVNYLEGILNSLRSIRTQLGVSRIVCVLDAGASSYRKGIYPPYKEHREELRKKYTEEEKESMAAMKNESYVKLLENMSTKDLSDEVKNTLDELRHRGYKLAIGSSSKNTKKILKQIGLVDYFDAISDGTNITKSKPDPEVFLKAADMVEEKPQNCLVVEDAAAGIDAACAGGFLSAGIGDAAAHEGVTYPIRTFGELLSICQDC